MTKGVRLTRVAHPEFWRHELWAADLRALGPGAGRAVRVLRLVAVAVQEFRDGDLTLRATGLVYTTLLSLVPFLAVAFSVLKAFGVHQQLEPLLLQALEPVGDRARALTDQVIGFVDNLKVGVLGAAGVAGLFYTTLSLLGKIEDALNHIWRIRRSRTLGRKFTDYLSVVLVGPVLTFSALALTASAQSSSLVQRLLSFEPLGFVLPVVTGRLMPVLFLAVAFTFLYRFMPNTHVRTRSALVGGLTAALLWQVAGVAFTAFVARSPGYAAVYSGFAILVVFLIWLDVAWLIVLAGAQVAYLHQHPATYLAHRRSRNHAYREWLALASLREVTRRHLTGVPPGRIRDLAAGLHAPPSTLELLVEEFVRRGVLLRAVEPPGIALARPPEEVTVAEVLEAVAKAGGEVALPADPPDAVDRLLGARDEAVRRSLAGLTLRALAAEPDALVAPVAPPGDR